jgi:hypothetical protein
VYIPRRLAVAVLLVLVELAHSHWRSAPVRVTPRVRARAQSFAPRWRRALAAVRPSTVLDPASIAGRSRTEACAWARAEALNSRSGGSS